MVFLTLVLRPAACRITNLVLAVVYAVSIVGATIGETDAYYLFLTAVEVALLAIDREVRGTWPRVAQS